MSSLLVVTGPPGAGKSTVSKALAKLATPSVLIEGDRFYDFLAAGAIEPWLPEAGVQNKIVTQAAAAATGRFAADYRTIYDGVVGPWFLETFAWGTGLTSLDYVVIMPPVEVCVSRVASRVGHQFTDEPATRKMHAEFDRADVESRHVLCDGSLGPVETAEAIGVACESGRLRYEVSDG